MEPTDTPAEPTTKDEPLNWLGVAALIACLLFVLALVLIIRVT